MVVVFAAYIVILCCGGSSLARESGDDRANDQTGRPANRMLVHLYFADNKGQFLTAEERSIPRHDAPQASGTAIIQAIIHGSRTGLMRVLPEETGIRAFFILKNGTAFVDLTADVREQHHGGVQMERLTIYAIVNSLILNVPEIRAVKILIGGSESVTLAGHMDLRFPFKANMLLIR